jgi:thiosulfate/3-mercaptopyruvate sulfurtransferase
VSTPALTSTLVETGDLRRVLERRLSTPPLRLVDARPGAAGRCAYLGGHLPGALHVDLDTDLAAIDDPAAGGRHPLPAPEAFADTLARLGVTPEHWVVAYDAAAGANAAARLWWMLRAIGHERAAVLDGGFDAAVAAGIGVECGEAPSPRPASRIPAPSWSWPIATAAEVAGAAADPRALVLDVRSGERYRGETEPFDPVAGHIPGSANLPFTENLGPDGRFRPADELRALYTARFGDRLERAVVHCGSGVTACHTLVALEHAGLPRPALYVGSWGEWCRSGRPVATGVENDV